jgi:hypothetical protein
VPTPWKLFTYLLLLHVCGSASFATMQEAERSSGQIEFRWLDPQQDSAEWAKINLSFQQELKPDVPTNVNGGPVAYKYKYVHRIGIFKTAAIVLVGHRETMESKLGDYFSAFNYDTRTGSKSAIDDADVLWQWKFIKLARFQPLEAPDVSFRYVSCTECEEREFVASFQYNATLTRWTLRKWNFDKGLLVCETPEPDDEVVSFGCLDGIADWNADGFDDVAVWRREVTQSGKGKTKADSSTTVYSFKSGNLRSNTLSGTEEVTVQTELCRTSKGNKLCKHSKN